MGKAETYCLCLGALLFAACSYPQVIPVEVHAEPSAEQAENLGERLHAVVTSFKDARAERCRLGFFRHRWGADSYINVEGAKPGWAVAQFTSEYLAGRGWETKLVRSDKEVREPIEVLVSGQVQEWSVNAAAGFGKTDLTAASKIQVQLLNLADLSKISVTAHCSGYQTVLWLDREDIAAMANAVLTACFDKTMDKIVVENSRLRLK